MLTGDTDQTAHGIAGEAGITTVPARTLPEDKTEIIQQLQADGHEVAIETTDIALMADELSLGLPVLMTALY